MTDGPVNLNRARKERARAESRARSDGNAAKYGRTKAQKAKEDAEVEKMRRALDQHRREDG